MSVNEKIRFVREAKGLTQEQVAEKLEISRNSYGDIERGDSDVKLSKLEKIAELFEMQLSSNSHYENRFCCIKESRA